MSNQGHFPERLDSALRDADWETAARLAHTLKGLSGQIGAQNVQALASVIELALKQHEMPEVLESLKEQVAELLAPLIAGIAAALPPEEATPVAPTVIDIAELREVCQRLQSLLEQSDLASTRLIQAHEGLLRAGLGTDFEVVLEAIREFDFEAAERALALAVAKVDLA